jgi:hypothetical protein
MKNFYPLSLLLFLLLLLPFLLAASSKDIKEELSTLLNRLNFFLEWSNHHSGHVRACDGSHGNGCGKFVQTAGINKLELQLTKVVRRYLNSLLQMGDADLVDLYDNGHKCSSKDAEAQMSAYPKYNPHICSEVEFYKIIHAVLPDIKTFVDVGANRGYIGSLMVSLWGGGGSGVSPKATYLQSMELDLYPLNLNPFGYCRTGRNLGYPLLCPDELRKDSGLCSVNELAGLRVMSLDGSPYLVDSVRQVIASMGLQRTGRMTTTPYLMQ